MVTVEVPPPWVIRTGILVLREVNCVHHIKTSKWPDAWGVNIHVKVAPSRLQRESGP
jgi:hypothetical protein